MFCDSKIWEGKYNNDVKYVLIFRLSDKLYAKARPNENLPLTVIYFSTSLLL